MEHPLQLSRGSLRQTDWRAGAVAGLVGGAVLMVVELLWTAATNDVGPWRNAQLVAAIVLGQEVTRVSGHLFSVEVIAVALATHYALGVVFGLVLGGIATALRLQADLMRMAVLGTVFGVALYLFNFYVLARYFPWFDELRGMPTLIGQIVFGITAALLYRRFAREPRQVPRAA
jgi:ribose/xylose/arabinose/galactoside ABC-type transport system permease subunit